MKRNFLVGLSALLAAGLIFAVLAGCGSSPSSRQSDGFWREFRGYAKQKNWNRMENVLRNNRNRITDLDKNMCLSAVVDDLCGEDTIRGFELLKNYNINPTSYELWNAFYESQPDTVIDYLLARGVQHTGVSALEQALKYRRFKYVPRLLAMVDNTNLDDRTTRANWRYSAADWKTEYSWTALIYAVQAEHFDTVRSLVERGANVNLRAEDGTTAASLAYDNGLINIYNYLKEHGAVDFEPRQLAQQPAASAPQTVYVQPSAPAQSSAPSTPSQAQRIQEAFRSPLQSGTYALAGTQARINLTAIARSGIFSYTNRQGGTGMGNYSIEGNRMTMQMEGYTFVYTVTSTTSFSGNGETWVRTGY